MLKIELGVAADQNVAKVFKFLKQYEPSLELGATIIAIREQRPVMSRDLGGIDGEDQLAEFLEFIDAVNSAGIRITLTSVEMQPRTSIEDHPVLIRKTVNRDAIIAAMKAAAEIKAEQRHHAAKMQEWLASEEGLRYSATQKRLARVRATLESRWEKLGYENLIAEEQDYIRVWCLCVEVDSGGFDQYFSNSECENALVALSSLEAISANEARDVLADAIRVFDKTGGFLPERSKCLECLEILPDDAFDDCNQRFHDLDEDIRSLALLHVKQGYIRNSIQIESAG